MELNQKRLERQLIGVEKWQTNKGVGTLNYTTGIGKTYSTLLIISKCQFKNPNIKISIIVPTETLYHQWRTGIDTSITNKEHISIYTIQYLQYHNLTVDTDLLIVDEVHEFYTEDRALILRTSKNKFRLGLTATYEDKGRERIISDLFPVIDKIDEIEALREGYISKYIEYNIGINLNNDELIRYKILSKTVAQYLSKFGNRGFALAVRCLSGGKDNNGNEYNGFAYCNMHAQRMGWFRGCDESIDSLWNPSKIMGYAKNLMKAVRDRKTIIYEAQNKILLAKQVIDKFRGVKTICFSQSTFFADKLRDFLKENGHKAVSYHSNLQTEYLPIGKNGKLKKAGKKTLRQYAIAQIKSGEAKVISTASALDKGFDVEDIRMAITTSGTSNPIQKQQRDGRAKRLEFYNPNQVVLIINIYIRDSQDEKWLKSRQSKSRNIIYWINSIDEITYKKENYEKNEDISNLKIEL